MACKKCEGRLQKGQKCVECGAIVFAAGTGATYVAGSLVAANVARTAATIAVGGGVAGMVIGLGILAVTAFCDCD